MRKFDPTASDDDILDAVRDWVTLLAEERYDVAFDFLYHPTNERWSPERIKMAITNYGWIEPRDIMYRVTPWETTIVNTLPPRHLIDRSDDDAQIGHIIFDLPINGEWSDLTATLYVVHAGYSLALQLEGIEVL